VADIIFRVQKYFNNPNLQSFEAKNSFTPLILITFVFQKQTTI